MNVNRVIQHVQLVTIQMENVHLVSVDMDMIQVKEHVHNVQMVKHPVEGQIHAQNV